MADETKPEAPTSLSRAVWLGAVLRAAPEFPGRNTLLERIRRVARTFDARIQGEFGPGLRVEGNPAADANSLEPLLMRYSEPELAPILRTALRPGSCFVDVGANVGTYSLLAASLVGEQGRVRAFEPVPATRVSLERNVALNHLPQLEIVPKALGAAPGRTVLHVVAGASGLSSRYHSAGTTEVEVEITTLDREFEALSPPELIKIDVEGMELEVLRGASQLLRGDRPPLIVFEAQSQHLQAAGTSYAEVRRFLAEEGGYEVFALGRRGLRLEPDDAADPTTGDVLAARPSSAEHRRAVETLRRVHFRDQEPAWHSRLLAPLRGQ